MYHKQLVRQVDVDILEWCRLLVVLIYALWSLWQPNVVLFEVIS